MMCSKVKSNTCGTVGHDGLGIPLDIRTKCPKMKSGGDIVTRVSRILKAVRWKERREVYFLLKEISQVNLARLSKLVQ